MRIAHMTTLAVITRKMNVGNLSCQSSVTCLCPFCDRSCQVVDWPQNVKSTNPCQVQTFQYNMGTTSDNSPFFSNSSFLIWWSSKQGWETLFHAFFAFFEHVLPCHWITLNFLLEVCPIQVISRLLQQKCEIQASCCTVQQICHLVCNPVEAS